MILNITVCIGSSCHIKGAREVVEKLQDLISENGLEDKIELQGSLCTGNCRLGVAVTVDGKVFSVTPEGVFEFFNENILNK